MKRTISLIIALAVLSLSVPSFADTAEKFRGGVRDVMMSPMQVSDNMRTESANAKFMPFGLTGGFLKGCFYMVKQIVTGTVDIVTSPVDMMHR